MNFLQHRHQTGGGFCCKILSDDTVRSWSSETSGVLHTQIPLLLCVFFYIMGSAKDLISHALSNRWAVQWSVTREHAVRGREGGRWEKGNMTMSQKYTGSEREGKASWHCREDGAELALDFCLQKDLQFELCTCRSVFQCTNAELTEREC